MNETNNPYHWANSHFGEAGFVVVLRETGRRKYTDEDQAAFEIAFAAALEADLKDKKAARKRKENMERMRQVLESMADE